MVVTALLGVGAVELLVIAAVFLALFGVDRIPEIAKTLGRLQGEWNRARAEVRRELRTEQERAAEELQAHEVLRERQVRASLPHVQEHENVRAAAEALGLDAEGKTTEQLRAAIQEATRAGTPR
ncbi:MAG TPA: twin-arginine translocase TatA/TatE family subunit [Candidatus Thermoplasmatota archaeon]|nr:twin-arginine translocase TatA/TatE family subunit [Candidatus Thermoplasmatota archaeon]